jgi:translation initiation factor eIF-2B subunit beta
LPQKIVEHSVGNTVRKVLHHIREEYNTATGGAAALNSSTSFSISKFVLQGQPRKQNLPIKAEGKGTIKENDPDDPDSFARSLKPVLMEAIQDVLDELETVYDNISRNAKDHIHSEYVLKSDQNFLNADHVFSEIILTIGMSKTVEAFLKSAAHYRNYTVIVVESGNSYVRSSVRRL